MSAVHILNNAHQELLVVICTVGPDLAASCETINTLHEGKGYKTKHTTNVINALAEPRQWIGILKKFNQQLHCMWLFIWGNIRWYAYSTLRVKSISVRNIKPRCFWNNEIQFPFKYNFNVRNSLGVICLCAFFLKVKRADRSHSYLDLHVNFTATGWFFDCNINTDPQGKNTGVVLSKVQK